MSHTARFATGPVRSPCISVCRMDPRTGWCTGCWRTLDEIAQWAGAADGYKRAVWIEIERRRAAAAPPITSKQDQASR